MESVPSSAAPDTVPEAWPEPAPAYASSPPAGLAPPHAPVPPAATLQTWLLEGLRAGVVLPPRLPASTTPSPGQLLLLLAFTWIVDLGLGRLEIDGPVEFSFSAWLAPAWVLAAMALLVWSALRNRLAEPDPPGVAGWFALWFGAALPGTLAWQALTIAGAREALPAWLVAVPNSGWIVYFAMLAWGFAVTWRLARHFGMARGRSTLVASAMLALAAFTNWQFPERAWREDPTVAAEAEAQRPRLALSQQAFEDQQALWARTVDAIAPQRPGIVDVYGLVFAPYAAEDVFLRESTMVANVLAERFDAAGRVLHLVNHATTSDSHPWATPLNLKRAIQALAQHMDPNEDVLVVYLTSHGARNFQLAAAHWPLQVPGISPSELRTALDDEGIKHRVIAISACYSGGWVGPLASDTTLVMTAADADRTSYGCGRLSELTFFGRAMFDEQLRRTRSFEQAFAAAVPVIAQREIEARKPDGFSNPQISVGTQIGPVLKGLEERLEKKDK